MPSPGEDIQSWSTTAINNGSADPLINWVEGQTRASVNNSSRSELAAHAKNRNLLSGSIVTTGSANAQAFLSGVSYTAIPTGLMVKLLVGAGLTNTSAMTLNMDGLGANLVVTSNGVTLLGGEFVAGDYVDLLYNGSNWVFLYSRGFMFDRITNGGGIIIGHQVFILPGAYSYTPTPGMECCIVECIGGGGGGGSAYSNDGSTVFVGGGGGAGGYSRKHLTAAEVGAAQPFTVGGGGIGSGTPASPGINGSATTFHASALCVANGGSGGQSCMFGVAAGVGGAGGAPGTGNVTASGSPGASGTFNQPGGGVFGAAGGSSALGGGAAPGAAASNYGGGGSGGVATTTTIVSGTNGSNGAIIITEFAGKGAPGRDGPVGPAGPAGPSGSGTGDVLRSGTPTAGQYARWIDASTIQGASSVAIDGVTDGSAAAAGVIGEWLQFATAAGSAVTMTSGTQEWAVSFTLPAGDWDVSAQAGITGNAGASFQWYMWLSDSGLALNSNNWIAGSAPPGNVYVVQSIPTRRVSLAAATAFHLWGLANFSTGTVQMFGSVHCRRAR